MVERLLACQHNVHVLCRQRVNPDPNDMVKYLQVSLLQLGACMLARQRLAPASNCMCAVSSAHNPPLFIHKAAVVAIRL